MRDGVVRAAIKAGVRAVLTAEHWLRRGARRLRGRPTWALGGGCGGCAKCCETPSLRTGILVARLRTFRTIFLLWQRYINGWELTRLDRPARLFVFHCTHFDPLTRRCDSYATRPFACRDYPRALLDQPWPELFEGCGYQVIASDGPARLARLRAAGLPPERVKEIAKRLRIEG